jgi:hypothetical protein
MDASIEMFQDMLKLAEKVGGTLILDRRGRLLIVLSDPYTAVEVAAGITNDDFMWGYVVPVNDSNLAFEF